MNIYKTHYIHNHVYRKKDGSIFHFSTRVYCGNFKAEQNQTESIEKVDCIKCLKKLKNINKNKNNIMINKIKKIILSKQKSIDIKKLKRFVIPKNGKILISSN